MEEKRNNNGLIVFLIIIIMALCGVTGYLLVDSKKDNTTSPEVTDKEEDKTEETQKPIEDKKEETVKEEIKAEVYSQIPVIMSTKPGATTINEKIATVVKDVQYLMGEREGSCSMYNSDDSGNCARNEKLTSGVIAKNNVIAIYMYARAGFSNSSGDGTMEYNYFYDVKNDKELTLVQALPLLGYTTADLAKFDVSSFEELTANYSRAYLSIKDGKAEIIFYDCRYGCA